MASSDRSGGDRKKPQRRVDLSEKVVEQVKRNVIFGEHQMAPPKDTRFKKGQSGNPKGRPKHHDIGLGTGRSANTLTLKAAERLIGVREGETITQTAAIEAVMRAQYASALKGNAYSQKHIIQQYHWSEREKREHRMNEIELWKEYVAEHRQAISDAKARGETPPTPLPHPDDVVIDYEKGVSFKGPVNEECQTKLMESLRWRDVLLMQDALHRDERT